MPIDSRIPLGVQPLQLPSPLEIYQTVQQIQGAREQTELRRLAAEEARARRAEQQQERAQQQALGERYAAAVTVGEDGTITLDKQKLFAGAPPDLVPTLVEAAQKDEARMTALLKGTLDLDKSRREWLGGEGADIVAAKGHPEAWDTVLRRARDVRAIDAATEARLRAVRDPAEILALAQAWVTRAGGKASGEGFTLSPGQARYGPGGELIAEGPAKPAGGEDPFTLSPGSVRFSPTGEQLASVPATPPAPRDERLVSVIGPDGKPVYVRESQALGKAPGGTAADAPGGVKLSAAQQEDIATMLTVEQLVKDIEAIDTKEKSLPGVGPIEGRFAASARGSGGATGETLRNMIGNIQGTIAKLRGGTSFTPTEQALLNTYTPTTTDTDAAIRTKLKSLTAFIQRKRANTVRVAAGDYTLPADATTTTDGGKRTIGRFEVEVR